MRTLLDDHAPDAPAGPVLIEDDQALIENAAFREGHQSLRAGDPVRWARIRLEMRQRAMGDRAAAVVVRSLNDLPADDRDPVQVLRVVLIGGGQRFPHIVKPKILCLGDAGGCEQDNEECAEGRHASQETPQPSSIFGQT